MSDVRVDKSYHESLIKTNHCMTVRCVETLKDLIEVRNKLNERINQLENVIGAVGEFREGDESLLIRKPIEWVENV